MIAKIKYEFNYYIRWMKEEKGFFIMMFSMLVFEIIVLIWR